MALYVRRRILKEIRSLIGSQCKLCKKGEICSVRLALTTSLAAEFCTRLFLGGAINILILETRITV